MERPASVVKELMENSLDAGASSVKVRLEKGGQVLIEVVDDGEGMEPDEIALAVTRHATSKISSLENLFAVQSFGFRGEALPSIASVSRLYLGSCLRGGNEGYFLEMLYGENVEQGPVAMSPGTRVRVQNLLANIPARLKFLKTTNTEARRCTESFIRMALARLEVDMELELDGRTLYRFFRDETLEERLARIWPEQVCRGLRKFYLEQGECKVHGMASAPENAQARGDRMYFYVNDRPVRDRMLISALRQAYKGRLLSREYPQVVMFLQIPSKEVDVNVHPAKSEVRFRNEKQIFSLVVRAVGGVLGESPVAETEHDPVLSATGQNKNQDSLSLQAGDYMEKNLELPGFQKDFTAEKALDYPYRPEEVTRQSGLYSEDMKLTYLGQVEKTYLLFLKTSGRILIMDQHGAHERIIFEQTKSEAEHIQSRWLAMPVQIHLHPSEKTVLEDGWETLKSLGFRLEIQENSNLQISGLPDFLSSKDGLDILRSILTEKTRDLDEVLVLLSCRTALKAGQGLTPDEAMGLAHRLMQCKNRQFCPHGRPICLEIGSRELERLFKRR